MRPIIISVLLLVGVLGGTAIAAEGGVDSGDLWHRLRSAFGLFVMIALAFAASTNRRAISWRLVAIGVGLQISVGLIALSPAGLAVFSVFNDGVSALLGYTDQGSRFLFGDLAAAGGPAFIAFGVLPTIIFFSSLMAILYHLGVMQTVVRLVAALMQKTMRTSGSETLSAAGNIFVGQTEAPLLVRPFLAEMTQSELMAVMTGGFATVAGGVMVAYVGLLNGVFPDIAGHLLCASVMSAPAALVVAKIIVPEPDPTASKTFGTVRIDLKSESVNVIDAAARGASDGLKLALNVGAMLLVFVALIAMVNGFLGFVGQALLGLDGLSLEQMLGFLCAPLAWVMGVPWEDARAIGSLIGVKTVLNEFVAYVQLAELAPELTHPRSMLIASYALCGFANFSSLAIQLGGISPLAPERRGDLARLGLRALVGGSLAGFMTACVIGVLS